MASLFDKIFGKSHTAEKARADGYFKLLTAYSPVFTSWRGELYESELVRSAIDARARHISKLKVVIEGTAQPALQRRLQRRPNSFQTWSQFLYRTSTILDMCNTAFVVPVFDERPGRQNDIVGYYTVLPTYTEIVSVRGEPWLKYTFSTGDQASVPMSMCAVLTKHQFRKDFFGEGNEAPLQSTMDLLTIINQGTREAVKNSATFRFMAQTSNFTKAGDAANEAKRFTETQFQSDGDRAVLLFPNTYQNIKQLDQSAYKVDTDQIEYIRTNVYNYFGVNENVLQNKANGDELDAFFNGAIEPFAIQFSEAMTKAMFTDTEQAHGAQVLANANRLQYMTVAAKVSVVQQLGDRGIITIDEAREMFNFDPLPDGKGAHVPIRGEYYMLDESTKTKDLDVSDEEADDADQ